MYVILACENHAVNAAAVQYWNSESATAPWGVVPSSYGHLMQYEVYRPGKLNGLRIAKNQVVICRLTPIWWCNVHCVSFSQAYDEELLSHLVAAKTPGKTNSKLDTQISLCYSFRIVNRRLAHVTQMLPAYQFRGAALWLKEVSFQQRLHVTAPVRDDEHVDGILGHPIDDAVGLEQISR